MGQAILPGNPPIEIALRTSVRARRLSLRVSGLDGRVTLTVPAGVGRRDALAFAASREDWLRRALRRQPAARALAAGGTLPLEGVEVPLVQGSGRAARLSPERIELPAGPRPLAALAAALKALARERAEAAVARHAATVGRAPSRLSLRDTRSRWGSCTEAGRLMLSWRLVMAPPEVLDYVAAHEVAHLVHLDHGPAFWDLVARLCPGHAAQRDWLRREGPALLRLSFAD